MSEVTRILCRIDQGDPSAAEELLPLLYDELKKLANARMANERPDHTLQATALVHEAYVRLVGANNGSQWDNRGHFFSAAAEAMRRVLVEYARVKKAQKRGQNSCRVALTNISDEPPLQFDALLDLHAALEHLEQTSTRKSQIVNLRYFGGLSVEETARYLEISEATVKRDWRFARAWLRRQMNLASEDSNSEPP